MWRCNLCGFIVIRILPGIFGTRCLLCTSTFIHRAVGLVLQELKLSRDIRVYELSSAGALFRYLRKTYRNLTFSEYFEDVKLGEYKNGIQCQSVHQLTFEDNAFDLVTSTEVFEHVPFDVQGFEEIYRVLSHGGYFVFTVPLSDRQETVERARLVNGQIEYLLPPEYHGDRIRGCGKVLAFRNYGIDILDRLKSVGFQSQIRNITHQKYAIPQAKVLVCRKE